MSDKTTNNIKKKPNITEHKEHKTSATSSVQADEPTDATIKESQGDNV